MHDNISIMWINFTIKKINSNLKTIQTFFSLIYPKTKKIEWGLESNLNLPCWFSTKYLQRFWARKSNPFGKHLISTTSWIASCKLQTVFCMLQTKLLQYYHFKLKTINYRQKIDEFIVLFSRYKGVSPYRRKNDTEKMVKILFQVDIKWIFADLYWPIRT